jgi:hypothetical protein
MNAKRHLAKILAVFLVVSLTEPGLDLASAARLESASRPAAAAGPFTQIDLVGPPGSGMFGMDVVALPNGNIVVTDPIYDSNRGAVYLYDGSTKALISTLTGSQANDEIGEGITVLSNGNFGVSSPSWANGRAIHAGAANGAPEHAGAVTWCNGATGCIGLVNSANSLMGLEHLCRVLAHHYEIGG